MIIKLCLSASLRVGVTLSVLSVFLSVSSVYSQLRVNKIFTDHMVLQREKPVYVYGKASPGESISVSFNKQVLKTVVAKDSNWSVRLGPMPSSSKPSDLVIRSAKQTLIIKDVLVGDVWICIGQSNMEWPMSQEEHYAVEIGMLPNSKLRFYDPVYAGQGIFGKAFSDSVLRSLNVNDFYKGDWAKCDTNSIKGMSAVGYYFGKAITTETGVPVGLINLAIGGAPIETFISREALSEFFPQKLKGDWTSNPFMPDWVKIRGKENVPASTDPSGPDHGFKPGFAFEAGLAPLAKFPVKGFIWYQGESNAQELDRVNEYAALQNVLVGDLRKRWRDSSLGFYYMQLSSIDSVKYRSQLWPQFRDEQRKMMDSIPHSGMAVTSDYGALNDVHPRNKKIVGERLARWALRNDYGKSVVPSGPLPLMAIREDSVVRIYFKYGSGLRARGALKGFSVDGEDVNAAVDRSTVIIHLPKNKKPSRVYYGWKPYSDGTLENASGLPASTFKLAISDRPSLIPLPKYVHWTPAQFELKNTLPSSSKERSSKERSSKERSSKERSSKEAFYYFVDPSIKNPEAYRLRITEDSVSVWVSSPKGQENALQTIRQLKHGNYLQGCEIEDWPAFPWRGYMVDVGRNFMSVSLLKQQIDIMAQYKLNIFHFHLTEDIAWRVEIPGFPQLTSAESMIRNKGAYYSVGQMKDLINYCRERNITMVPEIDMPGHSGAFERAMGVKMQSAEGKALVEKILESFCNTYNLEYIHIGGDEVKIIDSTFLPEIIRFLQAKNRKIIGWDPGGNLGMHVTKQLWMRDGPINKDLQYIDSRHLYINHMDPLESVVTIFHRKLGDEDSARSNLLGATLCLWHDRNVRTEADLMIMNPVYPAMLAFAEKAWRGGGEPGWITNTTDPEAFGEFEQRLLDHKAAVFENMPFPYWKQSDIKWQLYGPYQNGGDLARTFRPDTTLAGLEPALTAIGGTIILRHFWDPAVKGVLSTSKTPTSKTATSKTATSKTPGAAENTTWYAATDIWSDADTLAKFRIGFNNFSRSYVTDSPPEGQWNTLQSKIFVNGNEIAPPQWKQAGAKGNLELPLIDEGYEYRAPTLVPLKKGWNRVLVKCPVGNFKSSNFGNPVKWMFTVVKE